MIALPSIAFGGFSGSAKGVTARQVSGRSILSLKCWPTGMATAAQVVRRTSMAKITKSYKTLTTLQQKEWEKLAAHTTGASVFGQKAQLSGMNLYVRLNANRVMAGEPIISDAPAQVVAIDVASCRDIIVAPSIVILNGIKHQAFPHKLVVKMSAPLSPGISNAWSKTVILSSSVEDDWGGADVTEFYTKAIGISPIEGQKVFVELYWVDTVTGFTGEPVKTAVIVMTDEEAGAASRSSRQRITEDTISEDSTVTECEIEFSTGSPVIYFDLVSQGMSGVSNSMVYPEGGIPDDFIGTSYIIGRAKDEGKYDITLSTVTLAKSSYPSDYIRFTPGKAGGATDTEIFGVGVLL